MHHVKSLSCSLSVVLLLFLALASPGVAAEALSTHLPDGAKARLGRGEVQSVQYSPDGTHLAVGSDVGIWLYDARSYELLYLLAGHMHLIRSLACSPDGQTLASGGWDSTVRLWNATTGTLEYALKGPAQVTSVVFSPDGQTLASGDSVGIVRLWDAATSKLRYTLHSHGDYFVHSLAFSPDGRTLAGGIGDGILRLWDAATGELRYTLDGHGGPVHSLAFSPDGRTLVSVSSWDGTGLLWDLRQRHCLYDKCIFDRP